MKKSPKSTLLLTEINMFQIVIRKKIIVMLKNSLHIRPLLAELKFDQIQPYHLNICYQNCVIVVKVFFF